MKSYRLLCSLFCFLSLSIIAAEKDSVAIRVHFLHGSKPKHQYRFTEDRWFGGVLGGHAGIEFAPNQVLNFLPRARFHIFAKPRLINSRFAVHDTVSFYHILGLTDSVKKTIVTITISHEQKAKLDSIVSLYETRAPYDYAFFGMRCGAAAYDVLSGAGIVKKYTFRKTYLKIFYPRKLRRRLEADAQRKSYAVYKRAGSIKRKWEKD